MMLMIIIIICRICDFIKKGIFYRSGRLSGSCFQFFYSEIRSGETIMSLVFSLCVCVVCEEE